MKKLITLAAALIMTLSLGLTGCTSSADQGASDATAASDDKFVIGIVQPVDHPSLNTIRESIVAELDALGLSDRVEIVYKNAQGDAANINTIINQFVGDEVDMIIPIATGPAQVAAAATQTIPIVFAAVSYPVEAGLIPQMGVSNGNITGVSDAVAVEDILDMAQQLTPGIKTFGFIYNTGEVNSVSNINRAKAYCDAHGLSYVEAMIANSGELLQATQSLAGRADAIFTPNDNTVASAMPTLAAEAISEGLPVYTGADSMVTDGGLATVGIDYTILGKQVADMAARIIGGETIEENPVEVINQYTKMINTQTADALGIEVPEDLLAEFEVLK